MENSFFEYRDVADSGSDEEFIDNSLIEESYSVKKKNHTVFVAESEESADDESNDCSINKENISQNVPKTNVQKSSIPDKYVISSSDDDVSRRGSIRKQSVSSSKLVVSSSDEDDKEQYSPEMVPRRKQQVKKKSPVSNDSIIGHKTRKRIMLIDSDTDNSIVIEHDRHRKLKCLQDTPIKIGSNENNSNNIDENSSSKASEIKTMDENDEIDKSGSTIEYDVEKSMSKRTININSNDSLAKINKESDSEDDSAKDSNDSDVEINESSDDGPDEDQMVMSRATRMSIMGVIPKDNHNDSDDSDFIQSDESSKRSSTESLSDLPDVSASKSLDETHLSPLNDITNEPQIRRKSITTKVKDSEQDQCIIIGETDNFSSTINQKIAHRPKIYEDDVTIIETEPVIIALSSDDDELDAEKSPKTRKSLEAKKKSPNSHKSLSAKNSPRLKPSVDVKKRSPKVEGVSPAFQTIKKYLTPASYPNHEVRYVKKHEREAELMKLVALQDELKTTNNSFNEVNTFKQYYYAVPDECSNDLIINRESPKLKRKRTQYLLKILMSFLRSPK